MRRIVALSVLTVAVLFGVGAAALRWVALPIAEKMPVHEHTLRVYTGTAPVLLNPAAVLQGNLAQAKLTNVPLTVQHRVTALQTHGNNALIRDDFVVATSLGPLAHHSYLYVVNRHNLGPGTGFTGQPVIAQRGITFNWPIGVGRHDYTGWVPETRTTTTLHYLRTETHGGLRSYVFSTAVPPTQIVDPQELAGLPTSVPKSALPALAQALGIPASTQALFRPIIARLPAQVPLAYTFQNTATYWVDPGTGRVIDLRTTETRSAALPASLLGSLTPIAPVSVFQLTYTPASLAAAVRDSRHDDRGLRALGTTAPLALLIVAVVLAALGTVGLVRRRSAPRSAPPATIDLTAGDPGDIPGPRVTEHDQLTRERKDR